MRQMLRGTALALLVVVGPGCPGQPIPGPMGDMKASADRSTVTSDGPTPPPDLRVDLVGADLTPLPDLFMPDLVPPPPDLFMPDLSPPALAMLPNCGDANADPVNRAAIRSIVDLRCSGAGCHTNGGMAGMMPLGNAGDADTMRATFILAPNQTPANPNMQRIKNDPNNSYVLYKLRSQQGKVTTMGGGGMPPGGALSDDEFCKFLNWGKKNAP